MLFWLLPTAAAIGVLLIFLIRLLRRYDSENVQLAIDRVSRVEDRIDELQERLMTLEAIESDKLLDIDAPQDALESPESVSSDRPRISQR